MSEIYDSYLTIMTLLNSQQTSAKVNFPAIRTIELKTLLGFDRNTEKSQDLPPHKHKIQSNRTRNGTLPKIGEFFPP